MMGTEGGTKNLRYDASLGHFGRWKARVCAASVSSVVAKTEDRPAKAQRALAKFADIWTIFIPIASGLQREVCGSRLGAGQDSYRYGGYMQHTSAYGPMLTPAPASSTSLLASVSWGRSFSTLSCSGRSCGLSPADDIHALA